jgi:hypothetical protein
MAAPTLAARLKHVAAFVAIVWGVAATFVAFDLIALKGMDLAVAYQHLFGDVLLSSATSQSVTCVVQPDAQKPTTADPRETAAARSGAWILGLALGRDAVFRQYTAADSPALAQLAAAIEESAVHLGVPAPVSFVPEQIANANREFVAFVEADGRGTAHQLAVKHTPQACQVYKLGAVWGYSEVVRSALPGERAVFALEISHYAQRAGLPDSLWRPMMDPTPSEATTDELQAATAALTDGVTRYLASDF